MISFVELRMDYSRLTPYTVNKKELVKAVFADEVSGDEMRM
jgi:hypothetical protein